MQRHVIYEDFSLSRATPRKVNPGVRRAEFDFESGASTDSTTEAIEVFYARTPPYLPMVYFRVNDARDDRDAVYPEV